MARDGYKLATVELPEETHDDWKDFAEEHSEYTSFSHMIRRAVTREMHRVKQGEEHPSQPRSQEDVSVDTEPLEEAIYDLENRLSEMDESIRSELRQLELQTEETDEGEMKELMYQVGQYLPLVDSEEEFLELEAELELPPKEMALLTGTVDDIYTAVNQSAAEEDEEGEEEYSKFDVEQALAKLEKARGTIHSVFDAGERRYYEVEQ